MAKLTVYVGSGTQTGDEHRKQGIFVFRMDEESGQLNPVQAVESGPNPSFLAISADHRFLFTVNETNDGGVSAYLVGPASGQLVLINQVRVGGDSPCYISTDPSGRWLLVANYSSGSLSVLPVGHNGQVGEPVQVVEHEGSSADPKQQLGSKDGIKTLAVIQLPNEEGKFPPGVKPNRQERSHAHSILYDPGQKYILAADLGQDRVWVYQQRDDGKLAVLNDQPEWQEYGWIGENPNESELARKAGQYGKPRSGHSVAPGSGPRHIVFHPNRRFLYVSNEMGSSVTVFAWGAQTGELHPLQDHSTIPADFSGQNDVAHLAITPDGRFLYVSNRGHDSLAAFAVDEASGFLTPVGHFSTQGKWPRNFAITPDGRFVLAANQESDSVVIFGVDQKTGKLFATGNSIQVPKPMFVMAVDL